MTNGGNLKAGWKTWRFDQIAINVNERIDDPSKSGVEYYVGLEHLDPDSLKIRRWGTPDDVEATKLCFKKGDIIFGRRRAYQRKLGVAEFDGICSAHAMVLRPRTAVVLPEFLPFFMQSDLFMNRAVEISVGSLSPTINWKTLAVQQFALPPLEEQHRIVSVLSEIETNSDCLDSAIKSANSLLLSLGTDVFQGSYPKAPLGNFISESMYGPRFSNSLYNDNGPVAQLRTTDISESGQIDYKGIPRADLNQDDLVSHLLQPGDLVYSRSGTCGLTAVFEKHSVPTVPAAFLIRFRLNHLLNPHFLHEFFCSPVGKQLSLSLARGGVQQNVSASELAKQLIPIPTVETQKAIVERFHDIRSSITALNDRKSSCQKIKRAMLTEIS